MENLDQIFFKKVIILGASRGLGWATYLKLNEKFKNSEFLLVSRKIETNQVSLNTLKITQDFSSKNIDIVFLNQLAEFNPTQIIYCAGGGPHGDFFKKKWKDHEWALNVNFLFPAQLVHQILNHIGFKKIESITFVGSSIAENKPDRNAASYASAKHALRGLVTTLQIENSSEIRFKLFSPNYMKTDLLPKGSFPRLENKAECSSLVAEKLIDFIQSDQFIWPFFENK